MNESLRLIDNNKHEPTSKFSLKLKKFKEKIAERFFGKEKKGNKNEQTLESIRKSRRDDLVTMSFSNGKVFDLTCVSPATDNSYREPVFKRKDADGNFEQGERFFMVQLADGSWRVVELFEGGGNEVICSGTEVNITIGGPNLHLPGNETQIEGL